MPEIIFVGWPPTLDSSLLGQNRVGSNPPLTHLGRRWNPALSEEGAGLSLLQDGRRGFEPAQVFVCRQESNLSPACWREEDPPHPTLGGVGQDPTSPQQSGEGWTLLSPLGRAGIYLTPPWVEWGKILPLPKLGGAGNPLYTRGPSQPPINVGGQPYP